MAKTEETPSNHVSMTEAERIEKLEQMLEKQKQEAAEREALFMETLNEVRANQQAAKQRPSGSFDPLDPAFMAAMERLHTGKYSEGGIIRDGYLDPEDRMEQPALLFTNKSGIYLAFIKRGDTLISLPDGVRGPLKFETLYRDAEPDTGRLSYRGVMTVWSKRLLEALKKDDRFGSDFFLDEKVLNRQDKHARWAELYNFHHRVWMGRDENLVLAEVQRLEIPTSATTTNATYRELIAGRLADIELEKEHEARRDERLMASSDELLKSGSAQVAAVA